MTRKNFIQIIKLRSAWKIDKRIGNYELPNGAHLRDYVEKLVESQLELDNLGVRANGDLCFYDKVNSRLMPEFEDNEPCTEEEMDKRIWRLIIEIV